MAKVATAAANALHNTAKIVALDQTNIWGFRNQEYGKSVNRSSSITQVDREQWMC